MSHVFARAAAYYSPFAGVVDFPAGLRLAEKDGVWVSPCGTKAVHDPEVVERFFAAGSLVPVRADAAAVDPPAGGEQAESEGAGEAPGAGDPDEAAEAEGPAEGSGSPGPAKAPRKPAVKGRGRA